MDPNYAMAKFRLESKDSLMSKHRGCWYYTKYFFFFLSIIQFLIILGLVLFMLYGNAHVGTELRLQSLENRYGNLSAEYDLLSKNFYQLKPKVTSLEKLNTNCSNLLSTTLRELTNRSRPVPIVPRVSTSCESLRIALDQCNTTHRLEMLILMHEKLTLQWNYDKLNDKCEQTSGFLTKKFNGTASEVEKLQVEKNNLEMQIQILQDVCTDINAKFQKEIEHMKSRCERIINTPEHSSYSKCWSISDEIEQSIIRLKGDVNKVMFENRQLKIDNAQATDNLQKCSQEKVLIISEKNHLSIEKGGLERLLFENNVELSKSNSMSMKKEEELQNCRKMQAMGRMPVVPNTRTSK